MLEGSSAELAVLSQPSSPRYQQQQRSGAGSWFLPSSAASSRPLTPRSATAAGAASTLVPWQPQQLLVQQQQPSRFSRTASAAVRASGAPTVAPLPHAVSLPLPAWPRAEPAAAAMDDAPQQADTAWQRCSQDGPSGYASATLCCNSTLSLSGWQLPEEAARPAARAAEACSSSLQDSQPSQQLPHQQQGLGDLDASGSDTLPAATAWAPGYVAAAAAASLPAKQQQQPEPARVTQPECRSGAASGTVTPRMCSLSNLAPAGAAVGGSPQVTPRARSLRAAVSQQVGIYEGWKWV